MRLVWIEEGDGPVLGALLVVDLLLLMLGACLALFCLRDWAVLLHVEIHNSVNELRVKSSRRYTHQICELKLISLETQLKGVNIIKNILLARSNPNINLPGQPRQIPIDGNFNPL